MITRARCRRVTAIKTDRGSVGVLVCFIVLITAALTTVLVDAAGQIDAANRADTYSSEAARAASIAIGPAPVADGTAAPRAAAAARTYLSQAGVGNYHVSVVGPAAVQISVTVTGSTPLLGLPVSQTRTHTAQLQVGVTRGAPVP